MYLEIDTTPIALGELHKDDILLAGLYIRLDYPADDATIQLHKAKLEQWAEQNQARIVDCYIDKNVSGLSNDRLEYNRLLEDVKTGKINTVTTISFSMLSRNITDIQNLMLDFQKQNVKLYSLSETQEIVALLLR